jgi:N-acetylated-alpha-linked acidic dipeptidase
MAAPASDQHYEQWFRSQISSQRIDDYVRTLTARPTTPGAPFSIIAAEKTLQLFKSWGWDARIETHKILFPRPIERRVELLGDAPFVARLDEPAIPGDPYSAQKSEIVPPFFIYGPDGDVTAPLVYVNFGLRADYEQLALMGVDVRGKIVIARAGGMWRGGKVELAAEHGAKAMLIYSDPKEDGYYRELPYPQGPGRTPDGVQRGSILYGKYPGDPTTPGKASLENSERVPPGSAESSVGLIPAMPLSYADAQPLLAALQGQIVPESWRGALPISYRTGPSNSDIHLKIRYDWRYIDIHNVTARLRGGVYRDELVLRGNHRDGWVHGAQDPHSGHAAMLEEARLLGAAYRRGWRPKRTIVYNSWDAEEQGTIGSTEWAELHAEEISRHAVAYINSDVSGAGILAVSGSSSLAHFISGIADSVTDPASGVSVSKRVQLKGDLDIYQPPSSSGNSITASGRRYDDKSRQLILGPPGYGSDHHSFVSHFALPTLIVEFRGEDSLGAYHTGYDNYAWYTRFNDPKFRYAAATAQMNGLAVMRLADADILPMTFRPMADAIAREVDGIETLYATRRSAIEHKDAQVAAKAFELLAFRDQPRTAPPAQPVPTLDLTPLRAPLARITALAADYDRRIEAGIRLSAADTAALNNALKAVEEAFGRRAGLPGRPFYRNELYSPGRLWDTVPFPAIGDAINDEDWSLAASQVAPAAQTLSQIAAALEVAIAKTHPAGKR